MSVWAQFTRDTCCIAFDTETNGLFRKGSENPRMVALAWSVFSIERGSFKKRSFIVRADDFNPNPSGFLKHGINKAQALREGIQAVLILEEFKRDVNSYQPKLLVAHNIEFDVRVLKSECGRIGFDLSQELGLPKFCTMRQTVSELQILNPGYQRRINAYKLNRDMRTRDAKRGLASYERVLSEKKYKFPTLRELHKHFWGSSNKNWHNALADVESCERCFCKIGERKIIEHGVWLREEEIKLTRERERRAAEAQELLRRQEKVSEIKRTVILVVFGIPLLCLAILVLLIILGGVARAILR